MSSPTSIVIGWWRLPALAAALHFAAGAAAAQTVIVRDAPPRSTVEAQLNAQAATAATADANGDATLSVSLPVDVNETTVRAFVDLCGSVVRVLLVESGLAPPPQAPGCQRKEAVGRIMAMRRVTTFVVDLAGSEPSVHLRQGPAPAEWLRRGANAEGVSRFAGSAPTGLLLFGGGGLTTFSNLEQVACGTASSCVGDSLGRTVAAGAAFWIARFVGAQASYVKPASLTTTGGGGNFRFNSDLDVDMVTAAGNVGGSIGRVRIYGQGGLNHHRATFKTTETVDDATVTIDGVTQTIKGGTQTLELKTAGWGWLIGGGVEIWMTRAVALYAEGSQARLKGAALGGGEGRMDDHATSLVFGARVRIGR